MLSSSPIGRPIGLELAYRDIVYRRMPNRFPLTQVIFYRNQPKMKPCNTNRHLSHIFFDIISLVDYSTTYSIG